MRYSISNAIPHNPKSEKHPYENLVKSRLSALWLARQKGFEPPTFRLGGGCSIQLSYWRIDDYIIRQTWPAVNQKLISRKFFVREKVSENTLYRMNFFRYNKLIYYGKTTFAMEYWI